MAVKKNLATKTKKTTSKKSKPKKPSIDLSRIQKNLKSRYEKNRPVYIGGLIITLIIVGIISLFWFNKGLFLAGTINGRLVTTPEFYSKLSKALVQNNTSMEEVREQLIFQILIEKLLEDEISVSDEEVDNYIKENKEFNPDISKDEAFEAVKSAKLNERFASWFEELKSNANITIYF